MSPAPAQAEGIGGVVTGALWVGNMPMLTRGNGTISLPSSHSAFAAHRGAILCSAPHPDGQSIVTGGDDGRLLQVGTDGSMRELVSLPGRWIHDVAISRASGVIVAAAGRDAYVLLREKSAVAHRFTAPTSVGGLALDPKGRRLAVSHYGGVSLFWVLAPDAGPQRLPWKGSHLGVTWSPDGRHLLTAMQENALHGWRLADGEHMRMQGYKTKIRSMSWSAQGRWLLTSGADCIIGWPFTGSAGPMGKVPIELGLAVSTVTRVAAEPRSDIVAAGYADGSLRLASLRPDGGLGRLRDPCDDPITALAWSEDGRSLLWGAESGASGLIQDAPVCLGLLGRRASTRSPTSKGASSWSHARPTRNGTAG